MKLRKLLSLVLVAVMLIGCMTVSAFAVMGFDEITLDQTAVTLEVGGTKTLTPTVRCQGVDVTAMHSEYIEWSSTAETVATVVNGVVTAVKEGTATIKAERGDFSATCTVTVISGTATLDLDSNTKKEIGQNYTFIQDGDTSYTDVTKVKLEWTITDIAASYASNKTWDPDTLTWKETKTVADIADKTATFKLTNYSSKAVKANVAFAVENSLSATYDEENSSFTNNDCTVATPVKQDDTTTYQDSDFTALAQTITATLKFNKDKFADLSEATEATKYGTYTVTISEVPTVTWNPLSATITTATSDTLTVNYLPVFADNAVPENITFAYKDGEAYTTIENPTMSTLASYANTGTLYYSGSGTLVTVRSVNDISWNDTFKVDSATSYPYYASTAYADLQDGIKAKIATDGSETVEKLAMEAIGEPSETPTINGVSIIDIWNIYNSNEESSGFGGSYGSFWSCVAYSTMNAYAWNCNYGGMWEASNTAYSYNVCVLISRTFN